MEGALRTRWTDVAALSGDRELEIGRASLSAAFDEAHFRIKGIRMRISQRFSRLAQISVAVLSWPGWA